MNTKYLLLAVAGVGFAGLVAAATLLETPPVATPEAVGAAPPVTSEATPPAEVLPPITVYKSATCGCCKEWVTHLESNGFKVEARDVDNLLPYKEQAKLGPGMGSCHTAFVDGYAIEGHVPARDIKRLLLEKPAISGLTVPRMPIGSPGMEVPGKPADAYQVISYRDGEQVGVFTDYPAGK